MIKGLTTNGPYINIGQCQSPYISMSTPSAGMLRYNGNSSHVEVYDGSYWQPISFFQDINLSFNANMALDWAYNKMKKEKERLELAEKNNAVRLALDNLETAEKELDITINLAKTHGTR